MNMLLQIAEISPDQMAMLRNGMNTTWTTANLITLGGLLVAFVSQWIKMLLNKAAMQGQINILIRDVVKTGEDHKLEIDTIRASKTTIKQELNEKIRESEKILHDRITKTQETAEKNMIKVDVDFKEINKRLTSISTDLNKILGKLDIQ